MVYEEWESTWERVKRKAEEKEEADAPIAHYQEKGVTKGKGRFGPFIKYDGLFINVPKAYNFDHLSQKDIEELIEKKLDKEANRFIQQWPEEKIAIENGRWGPFIKFGKLMLKLIKNGGGKYTPEELITVSLEDVKKMIIAQVPSAFDKKSSKKSTTSSGKSKVVKLPKEPTKKISTSKAASAKTAPKKVAVKKTVSKKS